MKTLPSSESSANSPDEHLRNEKKKKPVMEIKVLQSRFVRLSLHGAGAGDVGVKHSTFNSNWNSV